MLEGGAVAVSADDDLAGNRAVRQMEDRIRELQRQLGRKTLEAEILKGPQGPWPQRGRASPKDMDKSRSKKLPWQPRPKGGIR